ncbi:hypothetical protein [Rhodanobacter denitrificans]|uniref:hypothetical protein n=1 Tax=Rhodanobacter denitrificans TaxID=666685 RepID=UPI0011C066C5|nr:hypothetical protein [Rhodanobacter denitrificans]
MRIGSGLQAVARLALVCLLASFSAHAAGSDSTSIDCNADHCGLLADGAYPNLVIGRLDHVDTAVDMARAFHWAEKQESECRFQGGRLKVDSDPDF